MRPKKILRLMKDFPNPVFDKRTGYGIRSIEVLPGGTFIVYYPTFEIRPGNRVEEDCEVIVNGTRHYTGTRLANTLLHHPHVESSTPFLPEEVMVMEGVGLNRAGEVLFELYKSKTISLDQILSAVQKVSAE